MLDVHYEVYIWFGWWPEKTHNSRNYVTSESLTNTGVSDTRWQGDKKLAIQTALNYVKGKFIYRVLYGAAQQHP